MYLKLSVAGHLTIFLTRTRGPFWSIRPARILLLAVLGTQTVATLIAVYGLFMTPLGWAWALFVWGFALAWFLVNDRVKLLAYESLILRRSHPRPRIARCRDRESLPRSSHEESHHFRSHGTLAESKSDLDGEMAALLARLLGIVDVAIISGGAWGQFEKQVVVFLPHDERLKRLFLLPACGTKFYRFDGASEKALNWRNSAGFGRKPRGPVTPETPVTPFLGSPPSHDAVKARNKLRAHACPVKNHRADHENPRSRSGDLAHLLKAILDRSNSSVA